MPYLQTQGIRKRYASSGVLANDGVDLAVERDEIHAVVGENGAGKTTLMKILCGLEQADGGRVLLDGREVRIRSPLDARRLGIGMVHQHFRLIPEFTVAENVVLGSEPRSGGLFLDRERAVARVREVSDRHGLPLDPTALVSRLTVGEMQAVEIVKTLYRQAQLLILDEPTSVLTEQQVKRLFAALRRLSQSGKTIVLITHKLAEVKAVADRVTVMRRGRIVAVRPAAEADEKELTRLMVGKALGRPLEREPVPAGRVVLELRGVVLRQRGQDRPLLDHVDLRVRAGEIVGVAGVSGNGLAEIEDLASGLRRPEAGRMLHDGEDVTRLGVRQLRRRGLAYVPADRLRRGSSLASSVADNLIVSRHHEFLCGGVFRTRQVEEHVRRLTQGFAIDGDPRLPLGTLSGGNIQKAILARELGGVSDLIVFSEPTWGLDVAASEFVYSRILELRRRGKAILLVSSNLDEILALADTVVVMYRGRVVARRPNDPQALSKEAVGEYMMGLRDDAPRSGAPA